MRKVNQVHAKIEQSSAQNFNFAGLKIFLPVIAGSI